jgi:hypothetical protein
MTKYTIFNIVIVSTTILSAVTLFVWALEKIYSKLEDMHKRRISDD